MPSIERLDSQSFQCVRLQNEMRWNTAFVWFFLVYLSYIYLILSSVFVGKWISLLWHLVETHRVLSSTHFWVCACVRLTRQTVFLHKFRMALSIKTKSSLSKHEWKDGKLKQNENFVMPEKCDLFFPEYLSQAKVRLLGVASLQRIHAIGQKIGWMSTAQVDWWSTIGSPSLSAAHTDYQFQLNVRYMFRWQVLCGAWHTAAIRIEI